MDFDAARAKLVVSKLFKIGVRSGQKQQVGARNLRLVAESVGVDTKSYTLNGVQGRLVQRVLDSLEMQPLVKLRSSPVILQGVVFPEIRGSSPGPPRRGCRRGR